MNESKKDYPERRNQREKNEPRNVQEIYINKEERTGENGTWMTKWKINKVSVTVILLVYIGDLYLSPKQLVLDWVTCLWYLNFVCFIRIQWKIKTETSSWIYVRFWRNVILVSHNDPKPTMKTLNERKLVSIPRTLM